MDDGLGSLNPVSVKVQGPLPELREGKVKMVLSPPKLVVDFSSQ